jgi:hypothetical protein
MFDGIAFDLASHQGDLVKQVREEHILRGRTVQIQVEEDLQKRMAHGHWCPYCKSEILLVSTCKVVYVVPNGLETQKRYGWKFIFSKANRKICCPDCVHKINEMQHDKMFMFNHFESAKKFLLTNKSGRVKKLPEKKGDDYRALILKSNGIDPATMVGFKVYPVDDCVGEAAGTEFEPWLRIFGEAK